MLYEKIDSRITKNDEDGVIALLSDIPSNEKNNIACILEISLYRNMKKIFSHILSNYDVNEMNKPSETFFDALFQKDTDDMEDFSYHLSSLVSAGLDIYQPNAEKETFIENIIFSENENKYKMLDLIIEKGIEIKPNPLKGKPLLVRVMPYKNLFKYLFDNCPNLIKEKSKKDNSFFITCIQNKKHDLVKSILDRKNTDVNERGYNDTTGVMFALLNQDKEMIELLLDYGADPKIKNSSGLDLFLLQQTLHTGYQSKGMVSATVQNFNNFIKDISKKHNKHLKIR